MRVLPCVSVAEMILNFVFEFTRVYLWLIPGFAFEMSSWKDEP